METVKLTIDNKHVEVPKERPFSTAHQAGINIPSLCYMNLPHLAREHKPGSCRVCVVEIPGRKNLVPACATPCTDGLVVLSHSLRAINARRTVVELLLSDHPKDCLICPSSGNCELQKLSITMGIRRSIPSRTQPCQLTEKMPLRP